MHSQPVQSDLTRSHNSQSIRRMSYRAEARQLMIFVCPLAYRLSFFHPATLLRLLRFEIYLDLVIIPPILKSVRRKRH